MECEGTGSATRYSFKRTFRVVTLWHSLRASQILTRELNSPVDGCCNQAIRKPRHKLNNWFLLHRYSHWESRVRIRQEAAGSTIILNVPQTQCPTRQPDKPERCHPSTVYKFCLSFTVSEAHGLGGLKLWAQDCITITHVPDWERQRLDQYGSCWPRGY